MDNVREKLKQYEAKYGKTPASARPKLSREMREERRKMRLEERLARAETVSSKADAKRLTDLLKLATLRAQHHDWPDVYALAVEVAHQSRTMVLGAREAHPVLSSSHPPSGRASEPNHRVLAAGSNPNTLPPHRRPDVVIEGHVAVDTDDDEPP